jgi:hypothetical protein
MSNEQLPIITPPPLTQDQLEERQRLTAIFDEIEKQQLTFLDEAGKSVIERIATFLAILFGVTAFGTAFPAYIRTSAWTRGLIIGVLLCYLLAMAAAMVAIFPRTYRWHRYQTETMAATLERMLAWKKHLVRAAGLLFALGTLALAVLIVLILWNA